MLRLRVIQLCRATAPIMCKSLLAINFICRFNKVLGERRGGGGVGVDLVFIIKALTLANRHGLKTDHTSDNSFQQLGI